MLRRSSARETRWRNSRSTYVIGLAEFTINNFDRQGKWEISHAPPSPPLHQSNFLEAHPPMNKKIHKVLKKVTALKFRFVTFHVI